MSYILSALKKAEQERRQGDAPDVLTTQRVMTEASTSSKGETRIALYLLAGVVALLASGVWLGKQLRSDAGVAVVYSGEAAWPGRGPAEVDAGAADSDGSVSDTPGAVTLPPLRDGAGISTPDSPMQQGIARMPPPTYYGGGAIPDIDALPANVREQLPGLMLSGHLYSMARPKARKVILNGVALKEKQYLSDDLLVGEITPEGVVLDFRGIRFSMDASRIFR